MKVYLITSWNDCDKYEEKIGIYSSKKKATEKLKELRSNRPYAVTYEMDDFELNEGVV